jgi:hypothetical protein
VTWMQSQTKPTDDPGLRMKLRRLAQRTKQRLLGRTIETEGHHAREEAPPSRR